LTSVYACHFCIYFPDRGCVHTLFTLYVNATGLDVPCIAMRGGPFTYLGVGDFVPPVKTKNFQQRLDVVGLIESFEMASVHRPGFTAKEKTVVGVELVRSWEAVSGHSSFDVAGVLLRVHYDDCIVTLKRPALASTPCAAALAGCCQRCPRHATGYTPVPRKGQPFAGLCK